MHLYERHASNDASDIACLFAGLCRENDGLAELVIATYKKSSVQDLFDYTKRNKDLMAAFIAMTTTKRHSFIKRELKKPQDKSVLGFFILMCIIGVNRAERFYELCNDYPEAVKPGSSYRASTASAFLITGSRMISVSHDYKWPSEILSNVGFGYYLDDEDD